MRRREGLLQVLLIHRPRYRDWSHPKGKCDSGEKYLDAAVREVWEETGLRVVAGQRLTNVTYIVTGGCEKKVKYWIMWPEDEIGLIDRAPDKEVDDVVWVTPRTAREMLTQKRDRELLAEAMATVAESSSTISEPSATVDQP